MVPARFAFLERGDQVFDYAEREQDLRAVRPVTKIFRPLFRDNENDDKFASIEKKWSWKKIDLVPDLFDTACLAIPQDTFRRKSHEAPWLETLFVAAVEIAFTPSSIEEEEMEDYIPADVNYMSEFAIALEQLLRVALKHDIQLSLPTLMSNVDYTGIFNKDIPEVQWGLIELFIKLGVDVFLPNSGFAESAENLQALLDTVEKYYRNGPADANYDMIKNGVMIPLMRGFTNARDLPKFMEIWYQALASVQDLRNNDSDLTHSSIWEDDDLSIAFGELVKAPFMDTHVAALVESAATEIKSEDGKVFNSSRVYANFVILEGCFRSRKLDFGVAEGSLLSIVETLTATLSAQETFHWQWRLWRFVRNLLENSLWSIDNPLGHAVMKLANLAAESIHRRHQGLSQSPYAPLENFEAYRLVLASANRTKDDGHREKLKLINNGVVGFIKSISNDDALRSMESPWDGRPETLNSFPSLALGYIALLVKNPSLWSQIDYYTEVDLYNHMLTLAAVQYDSRLSALENAPSESRFLGAWTTLVSYGNLSRAPTLVSCVVPIITERMKVDAPNRKLYVESLQRIPPVLYTRRDRGMVLNVLQEMVIQADSSTEVTLGMLCLMAKLAGMSKSVAAVTSHWEPIWRMAEAVTLQGSDLDSHVVRAFRCLQRAVICKFMDMGPVDRYRNLKSLYRHVKSFVSDIMSLDDYSMEHALVRITLSHLHHFNKQIRDILDVSYLRDCRQDVFRLVEEKVDQVRKQCKKQDFGNRIGIAKALETLDDFEDLVAGSGKVEKALGEMETYIDHSLDSEHVLRRLVRRYSLVCQDPQSNDSLALSVIRAAETIPTDRLETDELRLFVKSATEKFQGMKVEDLTAILKKIMKLGFTNEKRESRYLVAGLVLLAMPSIEDKDSKAAKTLSALCLALAESLRLATSVEQFTLATEALDALFSNQTRCMNQLDIDALMTAIAACSGNYGPRINPDFASTIFARICRLMGLLLSLHRQKVGGRYHQILSIITRLMNCVFTRGKHRKSVGKEHNQPPWLAPLEGEDAHHLSRVLSTLCDPTLSAVSRGAAPETLIDQVKKAKRIAGQHLQHFIKTYSRLSLHSPLSVEIKSAFIPGVYAVLAAIPRDIMRSMYAEMDVSSRAVFKHLYYEWRKYGNWDGA